jgi:hypothetical protein
MTFSAWEFIVSYIRYITALMSNFTPRSATAWNGNQPPSPTPNHQHALLRRLYTFKIPCAITCL